MNIAIFISLNFLFTLSSFATNPSATMYGNKEDLARFEKRKKEFIQAGAQKIKSLPIINRETVAALYDQLNSDAGQIRAELARTSGTRGAENFGIKRLGNGHITNTPVHGQDPGRDAWRRTVNDFFKSYLENMAAGKNSSSYKHGEKRTLYFTWLKETGNDLACYVEPTDEQEEIWIKIGRLIGLEYSQTFGSSFLGFMVPVYQTVMRTLDTFPKAYPKPESANINFIFMQIFDTGLHMGTYILAVDAGTSDDLAHRAQRALQQFSNEPDAPYTGLGFIHASQNTLPNLMDRAKEAFIDFVVNTDENTTLIKEYRKKLLTFRWYKSNEMYFLRGSLAVAEWLEAILALSASLNNIERSGNWHDGTVVDGMALSWPLNIFIEEGCKRTSFSWQ